MIDVSSLVGDIPTISATRRRFSAAAINAFGEAVDGAATDEARDVVIHDTGRRALERLGLDYTRSTISIYDTAEILDSQTARGDQWQYQGSWYEVVKLADYGTLGGIYMAHAQLVQEVNG